MTTLHAGGKFGGENGYKVSGGLHGVGASVVNALSTYTQVVVHATAAMHMQEYSQGKQKAAKSKKIGSSKMHGTIVIFEPDQTIFKDGIDFDWDTIVTHMRQQAYLVQRTAHLGHRCARMRGQDWIRRRCLLYSASSARRADRMTFYFEGGFSRSSSFIIAPEADPQEYFLCRQRSRRRRRSKSRSSTSTTSRRAIVAFANNIYNPEGGTHVTGFKTALTRTLNTYAQKEGIVKESEENLPATTCSKAYRGRFGEAAARSSLKARPKAKLGSVEAQGAVATVFGEAFSAFLEENPDDARAIISKVILALKARKAAKAAKDSVLRKGALEGMTLPGKLADCQTKSAEESELFIVEGDSAGGTAKTGRDRRTQAILPLRGKILNIERARLDKMLASEQIRNLVVALGTAIGDTFDISKLRYHKIIIATDADVDGAHIRTLFLTLFYRHFRPLIDGGFRLHRAAAAL